MQGLWLKHKTYLLAFTSLFMLSIVALFFIEKGDLVLYFSNNRNTFNNYFFRLMNVLGEGYAFALFFILLLFYRFRYALTIMLSGLAAILVSQGLKRFFGHPRPSKYLTELIAEPVEIIAVPEVDLVSSYTSSFPSGHTTAAFTLYTLLALFFPQKILQIAFLCLATLAALARVYLGQHFLEDITAGAFCGFFIAVFLYKGQEQFKHVKWMNWHLFSSKTKL